MPRISAGLKAFDMSDVNVVNNGSRKLAVIKAKAKQSDLCF
jgi:hypothetical protein